MDGEMVYVYGEVSVHRNSVAHTTEPGIPGRSGMPVGRGDVIATSLDAMAIISIDGGVFSRVTRRLRGRCEVRTLTAVAGVRGTEFFVEYGRTIDRCPAIWLCVNSGGVEVEVSDSGEEIVVDAGEGINIVGGTRLTKPRRYAWTRNLNWNVDPDEGEVLDTSDLLFRLGG